MPSRALWLGEIAPTRSMSESQARSSTQVLGGDQLAAGVSGSSVAFSREAALRLLVPFRISAFCFSAMAATLRSSRERVRIVAERLRAD
jgi:hypothetical protein